MASASDMPVPQGKEGKRGSRLDEFIGLKRESSEPWIARYADHIRILLPAIALAVVLAGVIVPMFSETTGILVRDMPLETNRGIYMRMDRPHFAGNDNNHRPYTVTADYAIQKSRDEKVYDLFQPKADILDKKSRWIAITADTGKYDQQLRMLDLSGNVTVFQDKGYTVTTDRARVDLEASAAFGDSPVRGHGPDGQVEAEGFHASERGDRIVFTGRSRIVLRGHDDTSEPEAPPADTPSSGG
ncbi:LPS export ABC transporter periplasmic protein LptC [Vineibacter terrae]|uniref:LPS export ABC transporter periplasmic protein LptC n=1 Tax=Vineibacter terrae TaxID=2586908 RepID=UPI002E34B4E7|nr:LPS export ABC transporter periplasmic protein LptC [Vineibacter terrae]HEX2890059.1 LPS export ABC transporter periplasmic protein LptC [Vineibacter terrae]